NDSVHSDQSESILPQGDNDQTEVNVSIIRSDTDQCSDVFSSPLITMTPNTLPYMSTPVTYPTLGVTCAPPPPPTTFHVAFMEVNSQIAGLRDISRQLQEQLTNVNTKLDFLIKKTTELQQSQASHLAPLLMPDNDCTQHVTVNSSTSTTVDQETRSIHVSTPPTAIETRITRPGNAQYSDVLRNPGRAPSATEATQQYRGLHGNESPTPKTLLIGDSILKGINKKGLKSNVECVHYPGAKVDTVCEKMKLFNLKEFNNLVVYVGGNKANTSSFMDDPNEYFEEKLEQLIMHVKGVNPECNIFISNMCPRGDTDVTTINDVISRQCQTHNVSHIDAHKGFFNKHNQLRRHFYNVRDNVHLSRAGTRRLLGSINEVINVVEDFAYCAFNDERRDEFTGTFGIVIRPRLRYSSRSGSTAARPMNNNRDNDGQHRVRRRPMRHRNREAGDNFNERCMKCGLKNHVTSECHHKNQLKCYSCFLYGHKDSFCPNA
ncbi:MAG: SGNH/GDSL hydrolase family protein, partial [Candidatus Thiodiazotropha endolucinida]|nr:SGNH/GDSL hydrolase family protein [Candidatus Thiodiazotropha taylori]MCW4343912.1 SGNH/GDSL hydrolase family protein [Candidatus Thiodiazotropha endolucinida]